MKGNCGEGKGLNWASDQGEKETSYEVSHPHHPVVTCIVERTFGRQK